MQIIVTGSRTCDREDLPAIWAALDASGCTLLIEGGAAGADCIAANWAYDRGVPKETIRANWHAFGKAAGPKRNAEMLRLFPDALVLAFPKGQARGTMNCVAQAKALGRSVLVLRCPE